MKFMRITEKTLWELRENLAKIYAKTIYGTSYKFREKFVEMLLNF